MIIKCPDCSYDMSDRAKYCLHCGCPNDKLAEEQKEKASKNLELSFKAWYETLKDFGI